MAIHGEITVPDVACNALWRLLKNRCRGERAAQAKPRLRQALAAAGCSLTARQMDAAVTILRNLTKYPVCTTGAGVFWAVTRDELLKADHYVTSRFDDLRTAHAAYQSKIRRLDARATRALPAGPTIVQRPLPLQPQEETAHV